MKKNLLIKLIIFVLLNMIFISQAVQSQTLSGRVYEGTTGIEPPNSKPIVGVTLKLYGSNDANMIGTFVISTTTTNSEGWYGLPVRGAFDFYNIVEENPAGYNSDGATSVSGTIKSADWIQYTYNELSQTTTGNKFWDKKPGPLNKPPIADADGPYTGTVNQPVQFDGSGSYDPDAGDSITSYEWDMDNDGQFDDATGVYPTWTWNSPTTQTIHLKVTDTHGATGTDSTFVRIQEGQLNTPPIADANGPYTGQVNQAVQFDGSGSYDPDAGDSITSYEWDMDNDGQFDDATGVYPTWTWNSPITQTIHLKVTDTHGATGTDSTYVRIEAAIEYDYGDAPDPSYPTLKASNGARHQIDPDVFLGSKIDADEDGQPNPDAVGDDNGNIDDEDGIVFKSAFIPGNWTPFEATVSVNGYLGVWVDFNGNGSWADPGESLFINDTTVYKGVNNWSIFVPANAKVGRTFARFRFSTKSGLTFNGSWQDGEVEDYQVMIGGDQEFGSVGDRVWHDLNQNGLQDAAEPGLDSVQVSLFDQNGNMLAITTTTSTGFYMFANITPGSYFINFSLRPGFIFSPLDQGMDDTIDSDAQPGSGDTQVFTLTAGEHNTNMDAGMYRSEGPDQYDFGDAPDPSYPTLLASNGARHFIRPGFYLGSVIDPEPNGLPTPLADGDNTNGANDEDGVTMSPFIAPGQSVPITVVASDTGVLNAWIDFNINGDWADAGEHFIPAMPVYPGTNSFTMNVPGSAQFGHTYVRFRFSSIRQLSYNGLAPDGEVEDYAVEIVEGDDGMITVIKEANPKDNTPFMICTQFSSGFFNILCVNLHDPLMSKWTILNPYQVEAVMETIVPGWTLMDITVTGDADNGSTINVATGRVDVDYDPGENIVIIFKNEKTGDDDLYDLGDAPDGTNHHGLPMTAYPGIQGRFPTVFDPATGVPQGPRHMQPKADAWLGPDVSGEFDADIPPDNDGLTNLDPPNDAADRDGFDDGAIFPIVLPLCKLWNIFFKVTIPPGSAGVDRYVNVWFDWNRDGDWDDNFSCQSQNDAPEWAVQNQLIWGGMPPGTYNYVSLQFLPYHPPGKDKAPIWMRITIAEQRATADAGGRGPANGYLYGETEDYYFVPSDTTEGEQFDFGDAPDPTFPTLLSSNGARHLITPNLYLGSGIDPEPDGQPAAMADGDDKNIAFPGLPYPTGDEDGVQIPSIITPGSTISVNVIASAQGALNAWLDFNGNGSWADAGEHIIAAQPVVPGINPFSINVPANAVVGQTYARFRLSSVRSISFNGPAPDGEVEDYAVAIQERGGGNIKIIKDADPKDNTPFWISVVYGTMGGAAPYRDPMMNTSSVTNAPAGIYYMGESVPAGWTLTDIVIIGDADNGSNIDVANGTVDVDLDPGEEITVTFKNKKTGGDEMFDLGDAPDGTNHSGLNMDAYPGVPSHFPTVYDPATGLPQGPMHLQPQAQAFLGYRVSLELEADIGADEDPTNNIVPQNNRPDQDYYDDGVTLPLILPDCGTTSFEYRVTVAPSATNQNFYVNVWFDWNRDGDWEDNVPCAGGQAPEWAVQNQVLSLGPGTHVLSTPTFLSTHPAFSGAPPPIWMRIMITTLASDADDGSGPANGYPFGETEDYYFVPRISGDFEYDFGDAPDNPNAPVYPTLHANGGAYHDVIDGFHLGAMIDGELNGQPTGDALGDDNMNIDDEDGVNFPMPLIPGQSAVVEVVASSNGILNAWIDYNVNSSWMESDEHVFIDIPVTAGNNPLSFNVPATAILGVTFARFRLSRIPGLLSTGYGHAGEVEDYQVEIQPGEVAPKKWFQRSLVNEDADMPFTPYFMGWDEPSLLHEIVIADDWFCKDPRPVTHIRWRGSYTNWDSAAPPAIAPHAFHIGIWTDVSATDEMPWSHPGELIWEWQVPRHELNEHAVGRDFFPDRMERPDTCFQYDFFIPQEAWFHQEGDSTIYWLSIAAIYEQIPEQHVWGWLTRQHYFHDDAVRILEPKDFGIGSPVEWAEPIGEMWDMVFVLSTDEYRLEFDFGDAPAERYQTFLGQNGAHHFVDPAIHLGEQIDVDPDGQPDELALGDDMDGSDDDDGVVLKTTLQPGQQALFEITASTGGFLNVWIDFNNNGNWSDPLEQIFHDAPLVAGSNLLEFLVPAEAFSGKAYARFRFSKEQHLPFFGLAINGEVEDYLFDIIPVNVEQNETATIPSEFRLYQNYPNPFNPETIIRFDLPAKDRKAYHVNLSIYNIKGQLIRTLMDEDKSPGTFAVKWDGRNNSGLKVNSGLYLLKIIADDYHAYRKMIILN